MTAMLWPRFSPYHHVNDAVMSEASFMGANPYDWRKVKAGSMTVADLIEKIRFRFGDRAANSVKIVVH